MKKQLPFIMGYRDNTIFGRLKRRRRRLVRRKIVQKGVLGRVGSHLQSGAKKAGQWAVKHKMRIAGAAAAQAGTYGIGRYLGGRARKKGKKYSFGRGSVAAFLGGPGGLLGYRRGIKGPKKSIGDNTIQKWFGAKVGLGIGAKLLHRTRTLGLGAKKLLGRGGRKLLRSKVGMIAAGGVGGYALGRGIRRRRQRMAYTQFSGDMRKGVRMSPEGVLNWKYFHDMSKWPLSRAAKTSYLSTRNLDKARRLIKDIMTNKRVFRNKRMSISPRELQRRVNIHLGRYGKFQRMSAEAYKEFQRTGVIGPKYREYFEPKDFMPKAQFSGDVRKGRSAWVDRLFSQLKVGGRERVPVPRVSKKHYLRRKIRIGDKVYPYMKIGSVDDIRKYKLFTPEQIKRFKRVVVRRRMARAAKVGTRTKAGLELQRWRAGDMMLRQRVQARKARILAAEKRIARARVAGKKTLHGLATMEDSAISRRLHNKVWDRLRGGYGRKRAYIRGRRALRSYGPYVGGGAAVGAGVGIVASRRKKHRMSKADTISMIGHSQRADLQERMSETARITMFEREQLKKGC